MIPNGSRPFRQSKRRSGMTLVELLAVIAIIGLLIGLLLPAVQSARDSARRNQCAGKVKQVALALQQHHEALGGFPPAQEHNDSFYNYEGRSDGRLPCQQFTPLGGSYSPAYPPPLTARVPPLACWYTHPLNFVTALLPYVDELASYNTLDFSQPTTEGPNRQVTGRVFSFTQCPSHPRPGLVGEGGAINHYGGPVLSQNAWCTPIAMRGVRVAGIDGMYWGNSRCKSAQIRDGLSNTIAVTERLGYNTTNGDVSRPWGGSERGPFLGGGAIAVSGGPNPAIPGTSSAWSGHPGGLHCGMADGATHFVSHDIDITIWQQLCRRADGQPQGPAF